jgi:hypothetical protein
VRARAQNILATTKLPDEYDDDLYHAEYAVSKTGLRDKRMRASGVSWCGC